jgi:adenylate cyclase
VTSEDRDTVEFLVSMGATQADVQAALEEGNLTRLAADVVLSRDATTSARELAQRTGTTLDDVVSVWRGVGVDVADPDAVMFSERDASFTEFALGLDGRELRREELARLVASAFARLADAAVSQYVQTIDPRFGDTERGRHDRALALAHSTESALQLGGYLGTIFGHHLAQAIARQRVAQRTVTERTLSTVAVGFIDLVGFTPLTRQSSPEDLLSLIGEIEDRAFHLAMAWGGQVVKHIGDEIMFVALDPTSASHIALQLMRVPLERGVEPRGGLAFGDVVARFGDYYGSIVNLAARLADAAIPGEILVDRGVVDGVSDSNLQFHPAGRRLLKGFDQAVDAYSLELAPDHSIEVAPDGTEIRGP